MSDKHERQQRLEADRERRARMRQVGLTDFLCARLDEDEAIANSAMGIWKDDGAGNIADVSYMARLAIGPIGNPIDAASRTHILRHQPSRVLREVEAGRAHLALMIDATADMDRLLADDAAGRVDQAMAIGRARAATVAVKHDAAVYSDHPDYQEEWKP